MSAIYGAVDADGGPPTTIPLRHVLVGLGFLVLGVAVGLANAAGYVPGLAGLAHAHLFFVGWVAVTILGAMTQFVQVWSGVALYSRRLTNAQLVLVAGGVLAFAAAFVLGNWPLLAAAAFAMLCGVFGFAYNLGRTLAAVDDPDVTERHFATALAAFVLLATLGFGLAADYATGVLADLGLAPVAVRNAHVTLAVFGAVLTTVYGALYQLATD